MPCARGGLGTRDTSSQCQQCRHLGPSFPRNCGNWQSSSLTEPARISEILTATQGRGFNLLLLLIGLPFLTPIPLPGFSTPFGLVVLVIGARLALGRRPWLPEKVLQRELPARFIARLLGAASRIVRWLEVPAPPPPEISARAMDLSAHRRHAHHALRFVAAVAAANSTVQQFPGTYGGAAGRRGDGAGRAFLFSWLRRVHGDACLLWSAGLWWRTRPRQPVALCNWNMKAIIALV